MVMTCNDNTTEFHLSPASNVLFSFKCTRLETCKTINIFNNSTSKLNNGSLMKSTACQAERLNRTVYVGKAVLKEKNRAGGGV